MQNLRIDRALKTSTDTRVVKIGPRALEKVGDLFKSNFESKTFVVIADENTYSAAGQVVQGYLASSANHTPSPLIFPGEPRLKADIKYVERVAATLAEGDAIPVAVGSGTINDIVKLAASQLGRPYMVVATAASMDGYASTGAAITHQGVKQTDPCNAARVILIDLDVLTSAPTHLIAAGYGDLLGKITAGADWILADALEVESINRQAFDSVQNHVREWIADPAGLMNGDFKAMESLIEGLILAGLAMQAAGNSRPASGSEHQFSHLWEMQNVRFGEERALHGFTVGLGTIAVSTLYDQLQAYDIRALDIAACLANWKSREEVEQAVRSNLGLPGVIDHAVEESLAKHCSQDALRHRLTILQDCWPELSVNLGTQLLSPDGIRNLLRVVGCPVNPRELGISRESLRLSYSQARMIRSRYTILDLVYEMSQWDEFVNPLFELGGFWDEGFLHRYG